MLLPFAVGSTSVILPVEFFLSLSVALYISLVSKLNFSGRLNFVRSDKRISKASFSQIPFSTLAFVIATIPAATALP